jgi:hypothetical protein
MSQLRVMGLLAPRPELAQTLSRFEHYAASRLNERRALAHKIFFRLVVPRNRLLAQRLPWTRPQPRG